MDSAEDKPSSSHSRLTAEYRGLTGEQLDKLFPGALRFELGDNAAKRALRLALLERKARKIIDVGGKIDDNLIKRLTEIHKIYFPRLSKRTRKDDIQDVIETLRRDGIETEDIEGSGQEREYRPIETFVSGEE